MSEQISRTKTTPMLKQYFEMKQAHPDKLLLFRMGDFYETFFEDAYTTSKVLNITLTTRNKNDENPVPLAGFPYHALNNYLDKLVKAGLKIAICEQTEDPKKAVGLVKREITEIITPGAILDNNLIDGSSNNFLACIFFEDFEKKIGLAFIDISTGEFLFTELTKEGLFDELMRHRPTEIIVNSIESDLHVKQLKLDYNPTITIFDSWQFQTSEAIDILKKHFQVRSLECYNAHNRLLGATASGAALAYIKSLYKSPLNHISGLRYYSLSNYMQLDEISRRNLEIMRSIRYGSKNGSLMSIIDQTQTPMGARLLNTWVLNPLLDSEEIVARQQIIAALIQNTAFLKDIRLILKEIGDINRLISRIGALRIQPRETKALKSYLIVTQNLKESITRYNNSMFDSWLSSISEFDDIINLIDQSISDDPPLTITEGGIFKKGYNAELDELLDLVYEGKSWIAVLEDEERKKTGIPSLKIGYNRVFGYYIEVTATHKNKVPDYYISKQSLANAERFISPRLKDYETKVLSAEEKIKNLEYELYCEFRVILARHLSRLQSLSDVIALIDVFTNLAFISWQNNYCRPVFTTTREIIIDSGRHPVIEKMLENEEFIVNETMLNQNDTQIMIITGPNMAGKSTYLRQIGLMVILAQIGSFVPAKSMSLPVFDRVFTRVGASDNLAQGQSTFLVEMIETANIMNSATANSLILLDEIGRGTSTFDGLSLAWAIIEYIEKHIKALTLFATHYHELTELESIYPTIKNYNVVVKEYNDNIIFLRKIERGSADQSYGIQVARLAGLPTWVITRAKYILRNLEEHEISAQGVSASIKKKLHRTSPQIEIFELMIDKRDAKDDILAEIQELDLDQITPAQAWQILKDIQNKL